MKINIVGSGSIRSLDMSLKDKGNQSHMGYLDIKNICNKYKNKTIIATHMHRSARDVGIKNPIKNLIIADENYEINI